MLFDRIKLSNESFEGAPVDTTEAIIEGDLAYADAMDIAREAMMDAVAMDTAQSAVMALDAKIANEEYLLANPEKITTETVVLAHESYRSVAAILGANIEDIEGVVSHESIESSPITAMQVSHEGVKDFIVKLYESIKLLFKKIGNAIKKVVVKLVVAMNGVEKAADKLLKSLNGSGNTPKKAKLEDKDTKVWNKYFTAIAKLTNTANANNAAPELINLYTTVLDANLNATTDELLKLSSAISTAVKKDDSTNSNSSDGSTSSNEAADSSVKTELETIIKNLRDKINKVNTTAKLHWSEFDKNDNNDVIIPVSAVNDKVKGIIISFVDGKDDNTKEAKFKMGTISAKDSLDGDITVITSGLDEKIKELKKFAKGLKGFSDRRIKEIDAMYKELDKKANDKGTNVINKFLLKQKASFGTNVRALVAGAYLDSVLAYSSASKKLLAFYRDHAKMYKTTEL